MYGICYWQWHSRKTLCKNQGTNNADVIPGVCFKTEKKKSLKQKKNHCVAWVVLLQTMLFDKIAKLKQEY